MSDFDSRIDFKIDSKHPYLCKIKGMPNDLKKYYLKYPFSYPMKIEKTSKNKENVLILTSDILNFVKKMQAIGYSNIYQSRKELVKRRKDIVVIKEKGNLANFCIETDLNVTYFKLLYKKCHMTYDKKDAKKCFTISSKHIDQLKDEE